METVDCVGKTVFRFEQLVDLFRIRQVGLESQSVGTLGFLWLDNVAQDELNVWGLGIG